MIKIEDAIAIIITILVTVFSLKTNYNFGVSDSISVEESKDDEILSIIKNGRYRKNTHASYYSVVNIYENELQYIKPESPNERQDWIADGSIYIYQEEP